MNSPATDQTPSITDFLSNGNLQLYTESEAPQPAGPLPLSLVEAFAEATGWELAWVGNQIKIVDMSATWPAKTPTAHRGKCDRVAEELSKLISS